MLNQGARRLLLLLLLLFTRQTSCQLPERRPGGQLPWVKSGDTIELLGFDGEIPARRLRGVTHVRIADRRIEKIPQDIFPVISDSIRRNLEIVNSDIDVWHANQMHTFGSVSIVNSSIGELMSGGIRIKQPDADSCRPVKDTRSVRIVNSTIKLLHHEGIVLQAADGSLVFSRSQIETLKPGGMQLAFRTRLTFEDSQISGLSAGAFCQVCSDIITISSTQVQTRGPVTQALSFGSAPACRERCPRQRLHVRHIADVSLRSCDVAQEFRQHLDQCQARQVLITRRLCDEGGVRGTGSAEDSSGVICGDLKLIANRSRCTISLPQLLQLLKTDPWWKEPAVGVTVAVTLTISFLLGIMTVHLYRQRRCSAAKRSAEQASDGTQPRELPNPPESSRRRGDVSNLENFTIASRSSHNTYQRPTTQEGIYEQIDSMQPPPAGPSLPQPPSPAFDRVGNAQIADKRRFLLLSPLPNPIHLYENLHGTKKRGKNTYRATETPNTNI